MECPLAKSPCLRNTKLRDTSSLDAPHLLGAADNDPVVEPRGIDRLSKRIDTHVVGRHPTPLHGSLIRHSKDARYLFHLPHDASFGAEAHGGSSAPARAARTQRAAARSTAQRKIAIKQRSFRCRQQERAIK
jgi:hypothetical protein